MLAGLVAAVPPADVVPIVNTGDDIVLHGLLVSPDLDTVTYTLAGAINRETGWGRAGETWRVMDALEHLGGEAWFRLGDTDLATHLYRTQRLADGASLSTVTAELAKAFGLSVIPIPMSDDRVETRVTVAGEEIGFQEYFVGRRHAVAVEAVRFEGAESASPAPGVIEAIRQADTLVICPSNPIVSIGPVLAVPGVRHEVERRRDDAVAVSPLIAGAALKGPADRLMSELGLEPSVVGVARLYAPLAATLVVDDADAGLAAAVEAEGMRCVVAPTIMYGPAEALALARLVIDEGRRR
jgi:LPPG:FO 2-phospho-L-lactate transferase